MPRLKAAGADVVIVSSHSGVFDTSSSYGDALPYPENARRSLAEQVSGIDVILVGHAHKEIPQRKVVNTATGKDVLLSEPYYWGMRATRMSIDVEKIRGQWRPSRWKRCSTSERRARGHRGDERRRRRER